MDKFIILNLNKWKHQEDNFMLGLLLFQNAAGNLVSILTFVSSLIVLLFQNYSFIFFYRFWEISQVVTCKETYYV